MRKILLFVAICVGIPFLLLQCIGTAQSAEVMTVQNAYANPTMGNLKVGAAFLEITNNGASDALVLVESPVAGRVEMHTHSHDNGVMRMRQVEEIALPAGETVKLQPGGLHIMLFELKQPLTAGETFPLTFKTKSGAEITAQVKVEERE